MHAPHIAALKSSYSNWSEVASNFEQAAVGAWQLLQDSLPVNNLSTDQLL